MATEQEDVAKAKELQHSPWKRFILEHCKHCSDHDFCKINSQQRISCILAGIYQELNRAVQLYKERFAHL